MSTPCRVFDLAIVGASFSGLVAARTAAMRGLSVVVLDRKRDAGHRVATTGILVKEAAEEIDVPHDLTRRVHGVRLYTPSLASVDLFAPGYFFLTTDTAALLRWLADEATRAGARFAFATPFASATRRGDLLALDGTPFMTRYLIGADGGRSRVARAFGLGRNTKFITGLEIEVTGCPADDHVLHCFVDSKIAPGYLAWMAPAPGVTQIGLAVGPGRKPDLKPFLEQLRKVVDLSAVDVTERRSGLIPCGGVVAPWHAPGVMLLGDAAGLVSPMTGGGIRLAFQFGRRAGHAVADHLMDLGADPPAVLARAIPGFAAKLAMRRLLDTAPPNWLIDAALATAPARALAQRIYFHRRAPGGQSFGEFKARLFDRHALAKTGGVPEPAARDRQT